MKICHLCMIIALALCSFGQTKENDTWREWFVKEEGMEKTPEDHERLAFFQSLCEKAQVAEPLGEIPKVFHVICLGPESSPSQSMAVLRTWIDRHPDWTMKLWTDQNKSMSLNAIQLCSVEKFPLKDLVDPYYNAESFDERSVILRYAILLNEGGIYIDPNVECLASFEPLRVGHDFFCGLEMPEFSVRSSSINPSCHLIAAAPNHPILARAKQWLLTHWDEKERLFPGTDSLSITNRMVHRSIHALSIAIEECGAVGCKTSIFPPHYFSSSLRNQALYAMISPKSLFGSRIRESQEKEKMQTAITTIRKQMRIYLFLIFALAALNLFFAAVIFHLYRKGKQK